LVTCSANAAQNLEKCVKGAGLDIDDVVLEQLASSYAVLSEDEKEHGVCLVDIGGGTTDIAVFVRGSIRHTAVIPIAGDQVTNDIAMALRTPTPSADEIKTRFACVVPRYEELFSLIQMELERSGFADQLAAGVVLTGGSSKIEGAVQLAESIFHLPVRIGMPKSLRLGGMEDLLHNPIYATSIGLLMYGKQRTLMSGSSNQTRPRSESGDGSSFVTRVKGWFASNF
jgi:cell division protein FtsA